MGGQEVDLPQPVDGEARRLIKAKDADTEPIPYVCADDIRTVIWHEMTATNQGPLWRDKKFVEDLVAYYQETVKDYVGRLAALNADLNRIQNRGSGLGIFGLLVG